MTVTLLYACCKGIPISNWFACIYHSLSKCDILFIYLFKHRRQRAQATYMPVKSVGYNEHTHTHTHTHPFNGPFSRTTRVGRYQKGKTNLGFTEARDSEWQWHQLGHMQVCTSLQTDNHASTSPSLSFLQAGCPSCRPTNSVKALKAQLQ